MPRLLCPLSLTMVAGGQPDEGNHEGHLGKIRLAGNGGFFRDCRAMKSLIAISFCLACGLGAHASPSDYAPFALGSAPMPFPVAECRRVPAEAPSTSAVSECRFIPATAPWPMLRVVKIADEHQTISLIGEDGSERLPVLEVPGASGFVRAYSARLNRDAAPDFILETWDGGCGLAFLISNLTFLLSTNGSYRAHTIAGYAFDVADMIDMGNDGQPELLHTMFIFGEPGKDGRRHNYWVYSLIRFDGASMRFDNGPNGFPKWIAYTFKPNHIETRQLTGEQKARLWREQSEAFLGSISVSQAE